MTRLRTRTLLVAVAMLALPAMAQADILSLHAAVQGGGAGGKGISGGQKDNAFHEGAQGVFYGANVGLEFFMMDAWVEHYQHHDGDQGLSGTWTQFMIGLDASLPLAAKSKGGTVDPKTGKRKGGYSQVVLDLALAAGFGLATGQQVDPPLDNSEITDKGFLVQVSAGIRYRFSKVFSMGVRVPVQYGYMFKSGPGIVANDENNQYQSVWAAVMLSTQIEFQLK